MATCKSLIKGGALIRSDLTTLEPTSWPSPTGWEDESEDQESWKVNYQLNGPPKFDEYDDDDDDSFEVVIPEDSKVDEEDDILLSQLFHIKMFQAGNQPASIDTNTPTLSLIHTAILEKEAQISFAGEVSFPQVKKIFIWFIPLSLNCYASNKMRSVIEFKETALDPYCYHFFLKKK